MRYEPEHQFLSEHDKKWISVSKDCERLEELNPSIEALLCHLSERLMKEQPDMNPIIESLGSSKFGYMTILKVERW